MDGRWTATLSYFDLTKQNVATGHPDPVLAALGFSVQTGEARNKGVELDVTGEVLPGLDVIATYAYTDSEITQMNDGTVGNRFPNVPKHAGSLWTTYRFQEPRLQGWKVGAGLVARGRAARESGKRLPDAGVCAGQPDGELYDARRGHATHRAIECGQSFGQEYFPSSAGFGRGRIDIGTPRFFLGSLKMEF
jgi:iron complex outermembrane receptor protein